MRLSPRKAEVEAVVAILKTDEEYDTLEDMAKDIIDAVADRFAERDWYAYGVQLGDLKLGYGPLATEREARKFGETLALGAPDGVVKLYSTAQALARIADGENDTRALCQCGHSKGLHDHPKMALACALKICECSRYTSQNNGAGR